jgi:hypothetical protein
VASRGSKVEELIINGTLFFFLKRTGGRALLIILSLNKRFYVQAKKRKMETKKKNYGRLLSHDCISEARLCFALWIAIEKSFLKLNLHFCIWVLIIKNPRVPFFPNTPAHQNDDLHGKVHS